MSLLGLKGYLVSVEVDVSSGLPSWDIVGLPDTSIKESKQRVRAALKNIGMDLPSRKITINLAPANLRKEGSFLDLPIAIGILCNFKKISKQQLENTIFIGELSLDGSLNPINGVLPICIEALKLGIKKIFLPYDNRQEAGVIKGLEVYPAKSITEIIEHLNNYHKIEIFQTNLENLVLASNTTLLDFADVKGQDNAKRALEIAAAGGHNCLLIGSPGTGKTMLSKRLSSILPDLTFEESLEITKIHSVAGMLSNSFITTRPFRAPHHSISKSAFVGGGRIPRPR